VTRKKKAPPKTPKASRSSEAYRPFAALKDLKIREAHPHAAPQREAAPRAHPASASPTPSPSPADDEALALHRMMSGVTPLDSKARRIPRSESALPSSQMGERRAVAEDRALLEIESVHAHLRALVEGGRFEVEDDGRRVEGRRAGVPPDVLRKLRRGLLPIDARIDLHGLRAEEARDALQHFLSDKRARGERCVLVVHGKGEHSPARLGILRGEMSAWLSQGAASVHVAAFSTAQPKDGGEGAAYVLLVR
jgi:DNA-nicking Smr family endonuclease